MELKELTQPPFQTTLMGVVKGALDYYGIKTSDAWAFGGSGHAFLINVHKELCPSGPYCWKDDWLVPLVRNLGLEMTDFGFFHKGTPPAERAALEQRLKVLLDDGVVCAFVNMEYQLIRGYDDKALLLARPWDCGEELTPLALTYGSWKEFGDEAHANFYVLRKVAPQDEAKTTRDSLRAAVGLFRSPAKYTMEGYGMGPDAYDNWAAATPEQMASHGNWWNATVWAECRKMAGAYFAEIAAKRTEIAAEAGQLSAAYAEIGGLLAKIASKEMDPSDKARIALDLKRLEGAAVGRIEQLLTRLG
jgi:hypothetical protein